jgi:glycolate oxidase
MMRNRAAIDSLAFRPRVLRDVSSIDLSGRFLGKPITLPLMLAPVGGLENFDPEGGAQPPAPRPISASPSWSPPSRCRGWSRWHRRGRGPKVFQLYVRGDWPWIEEISQRAIDAGYDAFCLTVDTAIYSRRERDIAKRFVKPWRQRATGQHFQAALNWDDVKRWKDRFPQYPARPQGNRHRGGCRPRRRAWRRGGLCVQPRRPPARPRPRLHRRAARGGEGRRGPRQGLGRWRLRPRHGYREAIILGAELVGMGRMYCYALAAAGESGVVRMFQLLQEEVHEVLGLLGVNSFGQLDGSYLHPSHRSCRRTSTAPFR